MMTVPASLSTHSQPSTDDSNPAAMREQVARWARFTGWRHGHPVELQALHVPDGRFTNNKFAHADALDDIVRLLLEADRWGAPGIYFIANRINPAVATRAKLGRWHPAKKGEATTDSDIVARSVAYCDIDPIRPRGTSATEEQRAGAEEVANSIADRLGALVPPSAIGVGMSGNGATVMIALADIPESKALHSLVCGVLTAIKLAHEVEGIEIDTTVSDAKRLCPAWGTMKRKGAADVATHPHRRAAFVCADDVHRLTLDEFRGLLDELLAPLSAEQRAEVDKAMGKRPAASASSQSSSASGSASSSPFPDDVFRVANGCAVSQVAARLGLIDGENVKCPGCGTVGDSSVAFVGNGLKCSHNRCADKGIRKGFRTVVDLVAEVHGCSPIEAVRQLGEWFGFAVAGSTPICGATTRNSKTCAATELLADGRCKFHQAAKPHQTPAEPSASEPWPAPLPLPGGLLPVPTFDAALLPQALRPWIVDIAERVQCPIEYVAVGGIVALGSVIGRQCGIRPKRHDDWAVIPNLWGGAVGPPGVMKSPALDESLRPLKRLAASARKRLDQALADHEHKSAVAKAKREKLDKEIKKAVMDGKEPMDPEEHRRQRTECDIKAPTERRYVVNDTTVEKLGELLNENPNGLLLSRDELTGWLRQLDRDGHEGDRAFMLEAWAGNKGFTYDRIARGTVHIEAACVSILGGIQPGPLTDYLLAAMRGGAGDDGLVQRFQLLVYPDITREWRNVDRWPDTHAKNGAYAVFEHLDAFTPKDGDADADGLRYLRFDTDAQALFDGWRSELEQRLRNPDESPIITAHLSKYRKLMPALALIFHLADTAWAGDAGGPVSAAAAQLAVHWCVLLEAHARRIYQVVTERAQDAARTLAKRIEAGKLPDGFTAREVRRAGWSGLNDREDVERALELLEDLHWLRSRSVATGGRPTVEYAINPQVRKQP